MVDKPKTELAYRVPASKITKICMTKVKKTLMDWTQLSGRTLDNSYDGENFSCLYMMKV